jgi:hypothetical protein
MKPQAMLDELEAAAAKLAVRVSYEALSATVGHGGLCRVKGQYRIIVDRRATVQERVTTLAESLAALDTSNVFLSPRVREMVEYYQAVPRAS